MVKLELLKRFNEGWHFAIRHTRQTSENDLDDFLVLLNDICPRYNVVFQQSLDKHPMHNDRMEMVCANCTSSYVSRPTKMALILDGVQWNFCCDDCFHKYVKKHIGGKKDG